MRLRKRGLFVFVLSIAMLLTQAQMSVPEGRAEQGPIAYWPFDEGDGSVAHDVAGSQHGKVHRATWTTGRFGSALLFDGDGSQFTPFSEGSYVETPFRMSPFSNHTDLTISLWFKTQADFWEYFLGYYTGSGTDLFHTYLYPVNQEMGFHIRSSSLERDMIEIGNIVLNDYEWHHAAFVRDTSGVMDVYVDGVLRQKTVSFDNTLSTYNQSADWFIGAMNDTLHDSLQGVFNGAIDEVKIYDRALTCTEIAAEAGLPIVEVGEISAPVDPLLVGTSIDAAASFVSACDTGASTATWNWGDEQVSAGVIMDGTATGNHTYDAPGVYRVELVVADGYGNQGEAAFEYVVVYDPASGFVTGGGWIDSPEGAYEGDLSMTGVANFGFVSKYKKGATIPTGQTQFQFNVANLNFHSSSYDWLVVTGSDYAMFKGLGTVNGEGEYRFRIWAGDGVPDTFRIRIWTEDEFGAESVVYDNATNQAVGGGSIIVHTKK